MTVMLFTALLVVNVAVAASALGGFGKKRHIYKQNRVAPKTSLKPLNNTLIVFFRFH